MEKFIERETKTEKPRERPIAGNVMVNGENPPKYESLRDVYETHRELLSDFIYTIVQEYGEEIENYVIRKRYEFIDKWLEIHNIPTPTPRWAVEALNNSITDYIDSGDLDRFIYNFSKLLFQSTRKDKPELKFNEFNEKYTKYVRARINEKNELGVSLSTILIHTDVIGLITEVYNNVILIEDENLDYVKLFTMISKLFTGLTYYFGENDIELDKYFDLNSSISGDGIKINIDHHTYYGVFDSLRLLIQSLVYKKSTILPLEKKLENLGFEHTQIKGNKRYNFDASKITDLPIKVTDEEKIIANLSQSYITDNAITFPASEGRLTKIHPNDITTLLISMMRYLHRYTWIRQKISMEGNKVPNEPKFQKTFRKRVGKLYSFYGKLFDEYFAEENNLEPIKPNDFVDEEDSNRSESLEPSITYKYTPFKKHEQPEFESAEITKAITINTIKSKLAKYGDFEKIESFGIANNQLKFIDSLLDYLETYNGDLDNLNQTLVYAMYSNNQILPRRYETGKEMRVCDKKMYNAIKFNLNGGKRLIVHISDSSHIRIEIMNEGVYHDNRNL